MPSPWLTAVMMLAGIVASAGINLLVVGYYIGTYKSDLRDAHAKIKDLEDEKKQERKDDVGIRERLRYLEAKTNMVGWKREV